MFIIETMVATVGWVVMPYQFKTRMDALATIADHDICPTSRSYRIVRV